MAASGYTPIQLYYSTSPASQPLAANLRAGELAINTADGKLYYKDSLGVVQLLAAKGGNGVTTFSGGTTGLLPNTATAGAITLSGTLGIANGGTNNTATPTAGAVAYGTGTAISYTAVGTSNQVLTSSGSGAPVWTNLSGIGVTTFSGGTTGLTPATATSGAITLAGTLAVANGGTGVTTSTGTGSVVLSNSPTLTTPNLGTPSVLVGTNISGTAANLSIGGTAAIATTISNTGAVSTNAIYYLPFLGTNTTSNQGTNTTANLNFNPATGLLNTTSFAYTGTLTGGTGVVNIGSGQIYKEAGGNVSIGSTANVAKLYVKGGNSNNLAIDNAGEQFTTLSWYNNGSSKAQTYWDNTNSLLVSGTDVLAAYVFKTNTIERMRVSAAGNVSIGTASTPISFLVNATDALGLPKGTVAQRPTGATGYIRYNTDYSQYEGYSNGTWTQIGGGATGGGGDQVFVENGVEVTTSYTLTTGKNAMSVGPITVDDGAIVTIPSGQRWVVL